MRRNRRVLCILWFGRTARKRYGAIHVIAPDATAAYEAIRREIDRLDYGFPKDRELRRMVRRQIKTMKNKTPRSDTAEEQARLNYDMSRECGDPPYPGADMADFARGLERELNKVLTIFRHRHEGYGLDTCRRCGLDLRHEIHERVESSNATISTKTPPANVPNAETAEDDSEVIALADFLRVKIGEWTVRKDDYDKLATAAKWLLRSCRDRLPTGHYAKLEDECRAIDAIFSPNAEPCNRAGEQPKL